MCLKTYYDEALKTLNSTPFPPLFFSFSVLASISQEESAAVEKKKAAADKKRSLKRL
jgi:hypothetical protein